MHCLMSLHYGDGCAELTAHLDYSYRKRISHLVNPQRYFSKCDEKIFFVCVAFSIFINVIFFKLKTFEFLKGLVRKEKMLGKKIYCCLIMDEIHIKSHISFNGKVSFFSNKMCIMCTEKSPTNSVQLES